MKYFIVAGEASGDLHGSNLMAELKKLDPTAEFVFFGGDLMAAQGGQMLKHYREMAFMGFITVVKNLKAVLRNLSDCRQALKEEHPDCLILIDYPGFNLRIARYAKTTLNLPVHYYVSPQIWAWKEGRIKQIRKYIDKLYCILPFEVDFYRKHRYEVTYVGSPVVDAVASHPHKNEGFGRFIQANNLPPYPVIALLCGSRKAEISANLPLMLESTKHLTDYQLLIAGAPGIDASFYEPFTEGYQATVLQGQTYRILQQASAALVTSGTATLETALFRVPQACCYHVKGGRVIYAFYKWLIHVDYISLVNLIAGKRVIKELVAHLFTVESARKEIDRLLFKPECRSKMLKRYDRLINKLGDPGASARTASAIYQSLTR